MRAPPRRERHTPGRATRDLLADWRRWTPGERFGAGALLLLWAGVIVSTILTRAFA
jgi:hypothetical protein